MHRTSLGVAFLAVIVTACASGGAATPIPTPTPPPTVAPTAIPRPTDPPSTAPAPTDRAPLLTGDAATNKACELATVTEIQDHAEAGVTEIRGLTAPGAYGTNSLSCAWFLDSEEIGIPSVTVQWEFPVTTWHDPVIDLYGSMVEQGLATRIDGVGEYAVLQGWTAEAVVDERIVRVSVLLHAEATPEDQEKATTLLRLLLGRTEPT